MDEILNIATYSFQPLEDLGGLRVEFQRKGRDLGLKGTILLSLEGINCSVAGIKADVHEFKEFLRATLQKPTLTFRESYSTELPFKRFLVKLKKEIITIGHPGKFDDRDETERYLSPRDLKERLDRGEDLVLLDTRNDYEVELGTFKQATALNLKRFKEFPEKINVISENLKGKSVVLFCTGGIRCEKAAAHLKDISGIKNLYQLQGGILQYFKDCGDAHYDGACFVYDDRVAVDANFSPTGHKLCRICGKPGKNSDKFCNSCLANREIYA